MTKRIFDGTVQFKNGTASAWTSNNITLAKGEIGIEIDTNKMKIGDGVNPWNSLQYFPASANVFTGATSGAAGTSGLVPAPAAGDDGKYLKGDGTWGTVDTSNLTDVAELTLTGRYGYKLNSDSDCRIYHGTADSGSLNAGPLNLTLETGYGVGIVDACVNKKTTIAFDARTGQIHSLIGDFLADSTHNFNSTGYQKLSNGLIIQWIHASVSSMGAVVTYPMAFPNAVLLYIGYAGYTSGYVKFDAINLSSSRIHSYVSTNMVTDNNVQLLLIGY